MPCVSVRSGFAFLFAKYEECDALGELQYHPFVYADRYLSAELMCVNNSVRWSALTTKEIFAAEDSLIFLFQYSIELITLSVNFRMNWTTVFSGVST